MKVLFVIDTLEIGGAERSLLDIASRLMEFTPVICCLYAGDRLRPEFERNNIRVHALNLKGKYRFLDAYRGLREIVREEKPALLASTLFRAEIISRWVARAERIPQLSSIVSDTYSKEKMATMSGAARLLFGFFYWINRLTSGFPKAYVANSSSVAASVGKALGIPSTKLHVIYRGRKVPNIIPTRPPGRQRFLSAGRLIPSKGNDLILEAFALLSPEFSEATLSLAGEGPDRPRLEKLIAALRLTDRVELLGQSDNMDEVYAGHDCLVFASRFEGFSGVIVEAMMAGMPVIASDIVMNKESVEHLRTGYLFSDGNVEEIRKAMAWFLLNRNEAGIMARAGHLQAVTRFNIETIVKQHEDLYRQIINRAKS